MKQFLCFIGILFTLFSSSLSAQAPDEAPHNTIYLVLDGVSRRTLYALLDKQQLPNLQKIIERGGYRNMNTTSPNTTLRSYWELLTGTPFSDNKPYPLFPEGSTVYERLKQRFPEMTVSLVLSTPQHDDSQWVLSPLLANTQAGITLFQEERRNSQQTADMLHYVLEQTHSPFFVMANFTSPEYLGHKYREGAEYYSLSVLKIDRLIGKLIRTLKQKGLWESTDWWITTNFGMDVNADTHINNEGGWVISSEKIRYKRDLKSVPHSILRRYKVASEGPFLIY